MIDYKQYLLKNAPNSAYYIPNFVTPEEEDLIINKVYSVPKPKWTFLSNRRLQDYGGVPHEKGMIVEKMPDWLKTYTKRVTALGIFGDKTANHVLVNEYLPGQGIMPHSDGPLFYPTVTTISCGSHTVLEFCTKDDRKKVCDLLLERRSLVILQDDMYNNYLHSIREINEDVLSNSCVNLRQCAEEYKEDLVLKRDTRISLTIRNVPKICKIKIFNL